MLSLPYTELVLSLLLTVTKNRPRILICSCLLIVQGMAYRPTICRFICSIGGFKCENFKLVDDIPVGEQFIIGCSEDLEKHMK